MNFDKRLRKLEDHYCRKIISCYLGSFTAKSDNLGEPINPLDAIIAEIKRKQGGVFPEALELLTPKERIKYNVQEALIKDALEIVRMETKRISKHYKPRKPK